MAGNQREIQVDGIDQGGKRPSAFERWYTQHPLSRRKVNQALLAGGATAAFGAGALVRDLGARQQLRDLNANNQNLHNLLDQEARDKEQRIGEPGITWEVRGWYLLIPVDEVNSYVDQHPDHRVSFTLSGPAFTRSSRLIFKKDENNKEYSDIDIRTVDGKKVYVLQAKPGNFAPGMPASFFARIVTPESVIAEKSQDFPITAYTEKPTPNDTAYPRVFSDENPARGGVDQGTLDNFGKLLSHLAPYSISSKLYIQRRLSPDDPTFSSSSSDLQVDTEFLKNTSNSDSNYYITNHAIIDLAFETYLRLRYNDGSLVIPRARDIQNSPLSDAFKFSDYVPSANEDQGMFLKGISARNLPDIVTVLRLFPTEFLKKFKTLDETQKALTKSNISNMKSALEEIAEFNQATADITTLIPDFQRISQVIAA